MGQKLNADLSSHPGSNLPTHTLCVPFEIVTTLQVKKLLNDPLQGEKVGRIGVCVCVCVCMCVRVCVRVCV